MTDTVRKKRKFHKTATTKAGSSRLRSSLANGIHLGEISRLYLDQLTPMVTQALQTQQSSTYIPNDGKRSGIQNV